MGLYVNFWHMNAKLVKNYETFNVMLGVAIYIECILILRVSILLTNFITIFSEFLNHTIKFTKILTLHVLKLFKSTKV